MPASHPELTEMYNSLTPYIEKTSACIGSIAGSGGYIVAEIRSAYRAEDDDHDAAAWNLPDEALVLAGVTVDVKDIRYERIPQAPHPFHEYVETRGLTIDVAISAESASTGLMPDVQGSILLTNTGLAASDLLSSPPNPKDSVETLDYDNYYTYEAYKAAGRAIYKTPEKLLRDYAAAMITRVTLAALVGEIINGTARQANFDGRVFSDGDPHELLRFWAEKVHPKMEAEFLGETVSLRKLPYHPLIAAVVAHP